MEAKSSEGLSAAQRRHAAQGAKGIAGRALPPTGSAKLRSALKRVGGKGQASAADAAVKPRHRAERASQAALGMMGKPPSAFDEAGLKDWLGKMSPEDLRKLGKLVWLARQKKEANGFDKVERQMSAQGVKFEIHGGDVTINLGHQGSRYPARRNSSRADWGRQLGRVKDFINGH